jgi:hypothetical protein
MAFHADRATFDRIRPPNLEEIRFDSFSLRRSLQREVVWWRKTTTATKIWGGTPAMEKVLLRKRGQIS